MLHSAQMPFLYLWSHDPGGLLLQDDFPTPLPLSLTEAYTTTT